MKIRKHLGLCSLGGATLGLLLATGAVAQTQPKTGDPLPGLTPDQLAAFYDGQAQFDRVFTQPEGLGPGFNDDSCAGCHNDGGSGGSGSSMVTRFGSLPKGGTFDPLADLGGSLLQAEAISEECQEEIPPEATLVINRLTTSAFGAGLVEAIPDQDLIDLADAGTGVIHMVPILEDPLSPLRVGRFGWKAQLATVLSFSGDAGLNEMGITNPVVPNENLPNGDPALLATCDTVADPEDDGTFINSITDFQRYLAPPPQTPKSGMTGEQVFIDTGCADCHVALTFTTGTVSEAALTGVSFKPYSDFLLHDMGGLGDGVAQGDAQGFQMRTSALWGLHARDPFLHDGRVEGGTFHDRVVQSVNFHGGDAAESVTNFLALGADDVDQLVAFLGSLGRREFDSDFDNVITEFDYRDFRDCFTGPGAASVSPDDPCAVHDIDQDGDVDLDDFDAFLTVYSGTTEDCDGNGEIDLLDFLTGDAQDCNNNLVPDSCDILFGSAVDVNANGVPDECETFIRADCNGDGTVDIADAIGLLDYLFAGSGFDLDCESACDTNSDAVLDIADAIAALSYLFSSGAAPGDPFPDCGIEVAPTGSLSCTTQYAGCP